ncbi:MAG TPA: glycosyltransferase family 2 protein, partial [Gemmatimonadaceae bacterium]|nr:glycosyltransferase family 2 protein [Gemmatimonadaceae bacterium]
MSEYCVVIPAKNAAKFLASTLESVRQQTCPASEIVVVDDGSNDATAEVARAAGVTVMSHATSSGPAASRNRGVAATTAPLVAFLDADDEWMPDHAERLLHALAAEGAVFAGSGAQKFGAETGVLTADLADGASVDLRDALIIDNPVIQSAA